MSAVIDSLIKFDAKQNYLEQFARFDVREFEKNLTSKREDYWNDLGAQKALHVFRRASKEIPAYKDFLKKHKVNVDKIKNISDFQEVPYTDKKNYISVYPLAMRVWPKEVPAIVAASSGTSGEAVYWPRGGYQEYEAAIIHELLYSSAFSVHTKKTLMLIGFPMGVYVSGVATLLPSWMVGQKSKKLTVASVGNNKVEMLKLVRQLSQDFEQTILIGHPFFIKDVVESGKAEKIAWNKLNVGMVFCSEGFSEPWREYVAREAGLPVDTNRIVSTYGCSEMLLIGNETPLTLALRRFAYKDHSLKTVLMGEGSIPSVFQYNPLFRYIEQAGENLLFTSASGVPLIRFNLHDGGNVFSYNTVASSLKGKVDKQVLTRAWQLPLVTLKGRSDYTAIFYAANIYPEHIHAALHKRPFLSQLTGKFTLKKVYQKNMDESLEIHIELKQKNKPIKKLSDSIQRSVLQTLEKLNMEYVDMKKHILGKDVVPHIILHPYQADPYFKPGLKPKYIYQE